MQAGAACIARGILGEGAPAGVGFGLLSARRRGVKVRWMHGERTMQAGAGLLRGDGGCEDRASSCCVSWTRMAGADGRDVHGALERDFRTRSAGSR